MQKFTFNLQDYVGKETSLLGVNDLYMERYICFMTSKLLGVSREITKIRQAFCKLTNLYQFPEFLRRIKIKNIANNQFKLSIIDDTKQKHHIFLRMINRWTFLCEKIQSQTNWFTIISNLSKESEIQIIEIETKILEKISFKRTNNARKNKIKHKNSP